MRIKRFSIIISTLAVLVALIAVNGNAYATGTFAFHFGSAAGPGQMSGPNTVANDSANNIYVVNGNSKSITKYDSSGNYILSWGSNGSGNGQFGLPVGIAIDSSDNVYVSDVLQNRIQKFSSTGTYITQWGSPGSGNSQFSGLTPTGIDFANGQLYVTDKGADLIKIFSTSGTFISSFGNTGPGAFAEEPSDVTHDSAGNIYVLDSNGGTATPSVKKYTATGTFISSWNISNGGDGTYVIGMSVDRNNNIYLSDSYNGQIRQFANDGTDIATFATLGSGNGQLNNPFGETIVSLPTGDFLYVADLLNERVHVFKILDPVPVVTPPSPSPTPPPASSSVVIPAGPPDTGL